MTDGVLLIHAFPLDARMWTPQQGDPRILAPNLPGFGGAEPAPGGVMTMAVAATACLEALDRASIDRAMICGLSMGGYVAFELWRRASDRIAGLVLADTRAPSDPPEVARGRRALADRLMHEGNILADDPPPLLSPDAPEELRRAVRAMIAEQPAASVAAAALGMADRPDSTPDLAGIDVPTLVIVADQDELIPAEASIPMVEAIPDAELATIEGAGHLSNMERPKIFSDLLRGHSDRCGVEVDIGPERM
jgi:3-oxoadipate enol-lactonase